VAYKLKILSAFRWAQTFISPFSCHSSFWGRHALLSTLFSSTD